MMAVSLTSEFTKGLWKDNPLLRLLLGMCPALAVTTSAENGVGMGLATTFVLVCSNLVVSSLRKVIPNQVRIPCFIVIIATFVTIVDMVMHGFFLGLYRQLGIFIPLIVVNCAILGRAEAFASKHPIGSSVIDGLGMGLGFTLALTVLGAVREVLGGGTVFGVNVLGSEYLPVLVFILPPGAFITLGFMLFGMNKLSDRRA